MAKQFALESHSPLSQGGGLEARKQRKMALLTPEQLQVWEEKKHVVMSEAMKAKFTQHSDLMLVLQSTQNAQLWHSAGRGSRPERIHGLEGIRNEVRDENIPDADVYFRFDGRVVAGLHLDPIQDQFPHYQGTLFECPALEEIRDFVTLYYGADIEYEYTPYYPHAEHYSDTGLADYVNHLLSLKHEGMDADLENASWFEPPVGFTSEDLDRYIDFLDWRRWKVTYHSGVVVQSIGLPPQLNLANKTFSFRPFTEAEGYIL